MKDSTLDAIVFLGTVIGLGVIVTVSNHFSAKNNEIARQKRLDQRTEVYNRLMDAVDDLKERLGNRLHGEVLELLVKAETDAGQFLATGEMRYHERASHNLRSAAWMSQ